MGISAGPLFQFSPSISFMINFDPAQDPEASSRIDAVWAKLIDGGSALMPLDKYPFSERYGWCRDRYGLSWQLILTNPAGEVRPVIIPSLMFVGNVCGRAEEASDYYLSIFGILPVRWLVTPPVWSRTKQAPSCSPTLGCATSGLPLWIARMNTTLLLTKPSR
ncbi:MAG: VOC family protein [Caldilineaceae bacterium]